MIIVWLSSDSSAEALLGILCLALLLDLVLGDPPWLYRVVAHPVALLGRAIELGEHRLYDGHRAPAGQILAGALLVCGVVTLAAALGWLVMRVSEALPYGWLLEALVASSLLAWRGLARAAGAVADGLERGLAEGRAAVAHIVGRDPDSLDRAGVARAAIESIAENFSDGVVAPVFWFLVLGLPGLAAYKALNTLDSMIGHKSPRYLYFGRAAARLDDWANWLPARLAGAFLTGAAALLPGASPAAAWRAMIRDAPRHRSPNAGWQEAALAGALGYALAGPRRYGQQVVEDPWMGNGRKDLAAGDIRRALALYHLAAGLLATTILLLWVASGLA
ncbi:MAG: adenosylcobinamide-phosphate synthase CbiB [Pseudomonadota bacterium]